MRVPRWLYVAALCASLVAGYVAQPRARATVVEGASLDDLVRCAELIVEARVLSSMTRLREQRGRLMPFTFHRLEPIAVLDGTAGAEILVMEPGGSTAHGTSSLSGVARYARGERVLTFLTRSTMNPAAMRTCALAQGKFTIEERSGLMTARRDLHELAILTQGNDPFAARVDEPPWELVELERTIRQLTSRR
jgi:hypothetical protein